EGGGELTLGGIEGQEREVARRLRGIERAREVLQVRAPRVPDSEHPGDLGREPAVRQDPGDRRKETIRPADPLARQRRPQLRLQEGGGEHEVERGEALREPAGAGLLERDRDETRRVDVARPHPWRSSRNLRRAPSLRVRGAKASGSGGPPSSDPRLRSHSRRAAVPPFASSGRISATGSPWYVTMTDRPSRTRRITS